MTSTSLFSLALNAFLNVCIKFCLLVFLFVVFYLALVRAAVITLPLYEDRLLGFLNQSEYVALEVGDWAVSDNRLFPEMVLTDVHLKTSNTEQTTVDVALSQLTGRVDLLASLRNLQLVFTTLDATDANLSVVLKPGNNNNPMRGVRDIISWLEKQSQISLNEVSWLVTRDGETVSNAHWSAQWALSEVDGEKRLKITDSAGNAVIQSHYTGRLSERQSLTGQSYFAYDVTPFLALLPEAQHATAQRVKLAGWMSADAGDISFVFAPDVKAMRVDMNAQPLLINDLSGMQYARLTTQNDLTLEWRDVAVSLNQQPLELSGLMQVNLKNKDIERVYVEQLSVSALVQLIKPFVSESSVVLLESLSPEADISDVHVVGDWNAREGLGVVFDIAGAQAKINKQTTVRGLSARVFWQEAGTVAYLDGETPLAVQLPIFDQPLRATARGAVRAMPQADGSWLIQSSDLELSNDETDANAVFAFHASGAGATQAHNYLSMDMTVHRLQGDVVANYIPLGIMKPGVANWLRSAFIGGEVGFGKVLFEGDVQSKKHNVPKGRVLVGAWVDDAPLRVSPAWPAFEQVDAFVTVDGVDTDVRVNSAVLEGLTLDDSLITIRFNPDVGSILTVPETTVRGDLSQMWQLFESSDFLRRRIPESVKAWQVQGAMQSTFALELPLRRARDAHVVIGTQLQSADVILDNPRIAINRLSGDLAFDSRTGLTSSNLTGTVWQGALDMTVDMPLSPFSLALNAQTYNVDTHSVLQNFDLAQLPIQGRTNAAMALTIPAKGAPLNLRVTTDMQGAVIDVPAPFAKRAEQTRSYTVEVLQQSGLLDVNIHDGAHNVAVQSKRGALDALHVSLNAQQRKAQQIASGYFVDGKLAHFSLPVWQDFLASQAAPSTRSEPSDFSRIVNQPLNIDVSLAELELTERLVLDDAALTINNRNKRWSAAINSDKLAGVLSTPISVIESEKVLVDINLSKLHLPAPSDTPMTKKRAFSKPYELANWHDANIRIAQLKLGDNVLGNLAVELRSREDRIDLQKIKGRIAGFDLDAKGSWTNDSGVMLSTLEGTARAADLRDISRALDKPVFGEQGATTIEYKLFWPDLLQDFSLKTATGSIYFNSRSGRFVEMDNYAALRILGVFNIANWQRRLRLDFKDLYQEGLPFDSIEGTFRLSQGQINTAYFNILGPSSQILMNGDINLNANSLDMGAEVVLPISKTLYAGCLIGLPACAGFFAVERAFGGGIEKAAAVNYALTGSFMEPQFKRTDAVKRKVSTANPLRAEDLQTPSTTTPSALENPVAESPVLDGASDAIVTQDANVGESVAREDTLEGADVSVSVTLTPTTTAPIEVEGAPLMPVTVEPAQSP